MGARIRLRSTTSFSWKVQMFRGLQAFLLGRSRLVGNGDGASGKHESVDCRPETTTDEGGIAVRW